MNICAFRISQKCEAGSNFLDESHFCHCYWVEKYIFQRYSNRYTRKAIMCVCVYLFIYIKSSCICFKIFLGTKAKICICAYGVVKPTRREYNRQKSGKKSRKGVKEGNGTQLHRTLKKSQFYIVLIFATLIMFITLQISLLSESRFLFLYTYQRGKQILI